MLDIKVQVNSSGPQPFQTDYKWSGKYLIGPHSTLAAKLDDKEPELW